MITPSLLLRLSFLALLAPAISLAQTSAGSIERIKGNVTLAAVGAQPHTAKAGDSIMEGDTLAADPNAEALVKLNDNSTLALRPGARLRISSFRFEKKPSDSVAAELTKGSMRFITGLIGKERPTNVRITTPTATVGIRGTDFELAIIPDGEQDRAGLYNYVYDGITNVKIASGEELDVKSEQTAFAPEKPEPGEARLHLLKEKPAFLRGGGFDAMMMQLTRPMPLLPMRR